MKLCFYIFSFYQDHMSYLRLDLRPEPVKGPPGLLDSEINYEEVY